MLRKFFYLLSAFMLSATCSQGQEIDDIYYTLTDTIGSDEDLEVLYDMSESKRNINEQNLDELMSVPLISEQQAKAILNYRVLYGDIRSMTELTLIPAIDPDHRRLLQAIFYAAPVFNDETHKRKKIKDLFKYGRSTLTASLKVPLYTRKGFTTAVSNGGYYGYKLGHSIRYRFETKHLMGAFTASQDVGEPFFSSTNKKGWDLYTGHIRLKNIGVLNNLIAGNFQPSVGMGLIMSGGYTLSRTSIFNSSHTTEFAFRGNASTSSYNKIQGIAMTIEPFHKTLRWYKGLRLSAFFSTKKVDASINNDSTLRTLQTSGLHRTATELANRGRSRDITYGGNITLSLLPNTALRFGLSYIHTSLSTTLMPSMTQKYNWYRAHGKIFDNFSISYSYINARLSVEGETAISNSSSSNRSLATCNLVSWKVSGLWALFALQRYYSYKYVTLKGRAFGDVINTQNESGVYTGVQTTFLKNTTISAYTDIAYHPWWRYGHAAGSKTWDSYLELEHQGQRWMFSMRYRYRCYLSDYRQYADGRIIDIDNQHTARIKITYSSKKLRHITQVQGTYVGKKYGWTISHMIGYNTKKINVALQIGYHDTEDWQMRLYVQQPAILYGSNMVSSYGKGIMGTLTCKAKLTKKVSISLMVTTNHFLDRDIISSGMQQINGNTQTDVMIQGNWKF